jgi:hypothetical protein
VLVKKFRLSIIQVAKSIYWKGPVEELLGEQGVADLYEQVGTKDALSVERVAAAGHARPDVPRSTTPAKPAAKRPAPLTARRSGAKSSAPPRSAKKAPPAKSLNVRGGQKKLDGFAA